MVQHLELVPQDSERITSNAEMQSAARELKRSPAKEGEFGGGSIGTTRAKEERRETARKEHRREEKIRGELTAWNPRSLTIEHSSPSARASATRSRSSEI